jgi:hypothetical protein
MNNKRSDIVVPRLERRAIESIIANISGDLHIIANEKGSCVKWLGAMRGGDPVINIHKITYRVIFLLYCWQTKRKTYPKRIRIRRVLHCQDRRCVNPFHLDDSRLPDDVLFAQPIPIHKPKKVNTASDEMSTSTTLSEDMDGLSSVDETWDSSSGD